MEYDNDGRPIINSDPLLENRLQSMNWDEVSNDAGLAPIAYLFECFKVGSEMSSGANNKRPKLMIVVGLEVIQPAEYAGRFHTERFVIGTENDPDAMKPGTYNTGESAGASNLNNLRRVTQSRTPFEIKDKRFMARAYKSGDFTNLTDYCKEGELSPGEATPPRNFTRKRQAGGGVASDAAPDANTLIPCMNCNTLFPQSEVAAHMATCTGVATT